MAISRMQEPRQLYGLGSLVKKAVRGVKKIVKSPLGKAAILGGIGYGAYYIYNDTMQRMAVLRDNNAKLEVALDSKDAVINELQNIKDKSESVKLLCRELSIKLENTMFVGNDINDIPALKIVGFPVAVFDAYDEIKPHVIYKTKKRGGFGAVREICDLLYNQLK